MHFFPVTVKYDVKLQAYNLEAPEGPLIEVCGMLEDALWSLLLCEYTWLMPTGHCPVAF